MITCKWRARPGVSAAALMASMSFMTDDVMAQTANNNDTLETVTVTGTNIRGAAPVGSNLIVMTPAEIKQTGAGDMQGVLAQNPALMAFSNGTQGQQAGAFSGVYQPSIHGLGSSGANTTMVLVDGHRFATSGTNHSEPDPNLIPINMVQRIDVLAEGASSIYGSDAIAGVINIITRKAFSGIETNAQVTVYPDKLDEQVGILMGKTFSEGWVEFAYEHIHQSQLMATDRPWTSPSAVRDRGGNTAYNFNCSPATIQMAGSSTIYTSATSGVSVANTTANGICSNWQYTSLIPDTTRDNAMVRMEQDFGSAFTLSADLNVASRTVEQAQPRGSITATVFGTGPQANPFYQTPAGYTGTATSETIRWDADDLLGPGAAAGNSDINLFGDINWEYRPGGDWAIDLLTLLARDESKGFGLGSLNTSAASLALNGTISSGGSLSVAVPNSTIVFNKLPLTTSSALDVWNPSGSNLTTPSVLQDIVNNYQARDYVMQDAQIRLQASGTVFQLPAGPLKIAFGAEANRWVLQEAGNQTNGSGPADVGSTYQTYSLPRNIYSGFVEANIPIVSPEEGVWGVQRFTIDLSARYDHYSDFGATSNPKASFEWSLYNDLKLRGNYSTSFVAPSIDEVGTRDLGLSVLQTYGDVGSPGSYNLPVSVFPLLPQMGIPGCVASSVVCNISSLKGLTVTTGDRTMHPDRGRSWSVGADFNPSFLPGLSMSGTLWWVRAKGAVQSSNLSFVATNPSLAFLLTLYPNGATAADIANATQGILGTAAISPGIQYIFQSKNSDWENLQYQGVDFNIAYTFDIGDWGSVTVSDVGSIIMNAHQGFGLHADVPPQNYYSITNTVGTNGTFSTIANQQRFTLAWMLDPLEVDLAMNYTGSFHNWGSSALNPVITNASGNPIGGGDIVGSQKIFDLYASYNFSAGILGDDQSLSLIISNLFNTKPPFENTATGIDTRNGSLLERGVALRLTSRF